MSIFGLPLQLPHAQETNIALVKYWGQARRDLESAATGSLSLTLANFGSETTVRFAPDAGIRPTAATRHHPSDGTPASLPFADG